MNTTSTTNRKIKEINKAAGSAVIAFTEKFKGIQQNEDLNDEAKIRRGYDARNEAVKLLKKSHEDVLALIDEEIDTLRAGETEFLAKRDKDEAFLSRLNSKLHIIESINMDIVPEPEKPLLIESLNSFTDEFYTLAFDYPIARTAIESVAKKKGISLKTRIPQKDTRMGFYSELRKWVDRSYFVIEDAINTGYPQNAKNMSLYLSALDRINETLSQDTPVMPSMY